jgi:restriction system protein
MVKQRQSEFTKWMEPILDALRKLGGSGTPREVSETIADVLNIPDTKREELMASGTQRFHNQVCYARQYLVWEGYIESSKRGIWTRSSAGLKKHITDDEARKIFLKWGTFFTNRRKAKQHPTPPEQTYEVKPQFFEKYMES